MVFQKGNTEYKKAKEPGRKGFGLEYQKKRVLEQAFHTVKKAMLKECNELKEKEKIELAKQVVLKEMGSKVDLTSGGEKLKVIPILGGKSNVYNNESDKTTT